MPDLTTLQDYESRSLVKSSRHPTLPLTIWCYTHTTQYSRSWDDVTRSARGLVLDDDGNVVARPLPKFFGYGDPMAGELPTGTPRIYEKMDGSLILVSEYEGDLVVTTKGSFTTDQAVQAKAILDGKGWRPLPGTTALFEFIAPWNRIVVNYKDYVGLVLLGGVHNATGYDGYQPLTYAKDSRWNGQVVREVYASLDDILTLCQDPAAGENEEGFVVVWQPSYRLKVKYATYLAMHRTMTHLTNRVVWEHLSKDTFEDLLGVVPDELYDQVHAVADDLYKQFDSIKRAAEAVAFVATSAWNTRREQADYVLGRPLADVPASLVFNVIDGRDISEKVWQMVYPKTSEKLW